MKFVIDINAGGLVKLLRMIGYDAILFRGDDDKSLISIALSQDRIVLTKDRGFFRRRLITSGRIKALKIESDNPDEQLKEVVQSFGLDPYSRRFSLCLECNEELVLRQKEEVKERVPPYVYRTQEEFRECPLCKRIYWKGTHWQAMNERLKILE